MKRLAKFLCMLISFITLMFLSLYGVDKFYESKINGIYYDSIGNIYASTEKNQGLILQEKSIQKNDNILIFGSSELGSALAPFYPVNFFSNKKSGFQVNLIGRGNTQSIIHTINFGALGKNIKNKKALFIISPQWFDANAFGSEEFTMNFSELQFYAFMFNKDIDKSTKLKLTQRINYLLTTVKSGVPVKTYCYLYSKNNIFTTSILHIIMPYYKFKYYILNIKDKIATYKLLQEYKNSVNASPGTKQDFNWEEERQKAAEAGKIASSNNEFQIENDYYDKYIKDNFKTFKGYYKNKSFLNSTEYNDLKLLLDVCKDQNIKPLFINIPVNGKWYDYGEFNKNDRTQYYKKVNAMISSYGYDIADFSQYEYEEYFLKDTMHLGWKGWVYVDEAINNYYHKK